MTHTSRNGSAGALNKVQTLYQDLRVAEVVNFLADLFEQEYQSRSLNAFRSAISSVHDRVDGV